MMTTEERQQRGEAFRKSIASQRLTFAALTKNLTRWIASGMATADDVSAILAIVTQTSLARPAR